MDSRARFPRNLRPVVESALDEARVVALTGPRQSGKTTLARLLCEARGGRYVSLDEEAQREFVRQDPDGALVGPFPLVLDEFQLGGDALLRAIKRAVDRDDTPGRFLLTGSAHYLTIPTMSESLAGRAALVEMWPLSQGEIRRRRDSLPDRLFGPVEHLRRVKPEPMAPQEFFAAVCVGGFPEALRSTPGRRRAWHVDYVRTIVERDVRALSQARRTSELPRLLRLLASRTANEVNLAAVSRDLGMPRSTLDDYVALLRMIGLWTTLPAWSRNLTHKVVKHPKGHVVDSGLAASMLNLAPDALARPGSPARGPLVETFVAGELGRQRTWASTPFDMFHFRDRALFEVDIVLEGHDGRIAAVETKAASTIQSSDLRGLQALDARLPEHLTNGVILYLGDEILPLGARLTALPVSALWAP